MLWRCQNLNKQKEAELPIEKGGNQKTPLAVVDISLEIAKKLRPEATAGQQVQFAVKMLDPLRLIAIKSSGFAAPLLERV